MVSAQTGSGIPELLHAIEIRLPRHKVHVHVCVPYSRGEILARIHQVGENVSVVHGESGSVVDADVPENLAAELKSLDFMIGDLVERS
jgi:GTP-binding protein HflX